MLPYFLCWIWIAWPAFAGRQYWSVLTTFLISLFLSIFIGLRYEIGADWFNYLPYLDRQYGMPIGFALLSTEPGYAIINWISSRLDWGVFGVNLICGGIISAALVRYCRKRPYPWLALILAFPYLVVVVAMGYTRQSVAIGLELLALLALEQDQQIQFMAWIGLASTFHASALTILMLPLASIRRNLGRMTGLLNLLFLAGTCYGLYTAILSGSVQSYEQIYLEAKYQSQGALIRIVLCLLPALVFLWNRCEFPITPQQRAIYTLMSWLAVAAGIALAVSPSSTAVDRVALYLIPLQIFVGSYLPLIRLQGFSTVFWCQLLVFLSLAVLSVWLFFAANASAWLPYRNLLFEFT